MSDVTRLPHFERPPVKQVVLGVAFEPLLRLRASHIGLFWGELNRDDRFPVVDEFKPSKLHMERFDNDDMPSDVVELSVTGAESVPRVVISSEDYSRQIAVQRDVLQVSWRQVGGAPYPRFESPRNLFYETIFAFQKFLDAQRLGRMKLRQAEVSYMNAIPLRKGDVQQQAEDLVSFKLVTGDGVPTSDHFHTFQRHTLEDDTGRWARLYIAFDSETSSVEPESDMVDGQLSFSVQGPVKDRDEAISFVERGHQVIVDSFVATMTPFGKIAWGEIEGGV